MVCFGWLQRSLAPLTEACPVDALLGYHCGVIGPMLSDAVRGDGCKGISAAVQGYCRSLQVCSKAAMCSISVLIRSLYLDLLATSH